MELFGSTTLVDLVKVDELAHVQMTAKMSKSALTLCQTWRQCLASCLPCMANSPALVDTAIHYLLHLYGPLSRSLVAVGEHNLVQSAEEAWHLGKLLHRMEQARSRHLRKGGHVAYILVGRFRVSPSKGVKLIGGDKNVGPKQTFMLPTELSQHFGRCSEILLQLGPIQDSLLLRIGLQHTPGGHRHEVPRKLQLDAGTACPHMILNYKGAALKPKRCMCHATVGMHSFSTRSIPFDTDSSPEVLCAFLVRDGLHDMGNSTLAHALNLDKIRQP